MANVNPIEVLVDMHAVHTMVLVQESTGIMQCLNCGRWARTPTRTLLDSVVCVPDEGDDESECEEVR